MNTFVVQWVGKIVDDTGWDYLDAETVEQARNVWLERNEDTRQIVSISMAL